jgi:hypothetical protein
MLETHIIETHCWATTFSDPSSSCESRSRKLGGKPRQAQTTCPVTIPVSSRRAGMVRSAPPLFTKSRPATSFVYKAGDTAGKSPHLGINAPGGAHCLVQPPDETGPCATLHEPGGAPDDPSLLRSFPFSSDGGKEGGELLRGTLKQTMCSRGGGAKQSGGTRSGSCGSPRV